MRAICPNCNKGFITTKWKLQINKQCFCSRECHNEYRKKEKYKEMCNAVGQDFKEWLYDKYVNEMKTTRQIALELYGNSKNHSSVNNWLKRYDIPLRQGSEAIKTQWIDNDERRELSREIANAYLLDEEVRDRIKEIQQTEEYREKARIAKLGEKNGMYGKYGEKHHNWNPDLTDEERINGRKSTEDNLWRKEVFERDNYTCQYCGDDTGGNLNAHHIYSHDKYEDKRYDVDNGITLCEACHKEFHIQYGYGNNTKRQFNKFMNSKNKALA